MSGNHLALGLPRFPVAAGFHAANAASQTMSVDEVFIIVSSLAA